MNAISECRAMSIKCKTESGITDEVTNSTLPPCAESTRKPEVHDKPIPPKDDDDDDASNDDVFFSSRSAYLLIVIGGVIALPALTFARVCWNRKLGEERRRMLLEISQGRREEEDGFHSIFAISHGEKYVQLFYNIINVNVIKLDWC